MRQLHCAINHWLVMQIYADENVIDGIEVCSLLHSDTLKYDLRVMFVMNQLYQVSRLIHGMNFIDTCWGVTREYFCFE